MDKRLYAWLGKWGDALSEQARKEFRAAIEEPAVVIADVPKETPPPSSSSKKSKLVKKNPGEPCRRGDASVDKNGAPFTHHYDKTLGYCIFCGDGLEQDTTPDPGANIYANGGVERVWCNEHGFFHDVKVKPDGTLYDFPEDCAMFKKQTEHEVSE